MKFIAIAIIASFVLSVTVAAPLTPLEDDDFETVQVLQEIAPPEQFPELYDIDTKSNETINLAITLECLKNAFNKVAVENNLAELWKNVKRRIGEAIQRIRECQSNNQSPSAASQCIRRELQNIHRSLHEFITNLVAEDRLNILRKLREEIVRQCKKPAENVEWIESEQESYDNSQQEGFSDYLKCLMRVIDDVVKQHGEEVSELWQESKKKLSAIVEELKKCKESSGGDYAECVRKQVWEGTKTLADFIRQLIQEGFGGLLSEIQHQVSEECRSDQQFQLTDNIKMY